MLESGVKLFTSYVSSTYHISVNSVHGNYSFLNLALLSVTKGHSIYIRLGKLFKGWYNSRAETIRRNAVILEEKTNFENDHNAYNDVEISYKFWYEN